MAFPSCHFDNRSRGEDGGHGSDGSPGSSAGAWKTCIAIVVVFLLLSNGQKIAAAASRYFGPRQAAKAAPSAAAVSAPVPVADALRVDQDAVLPPDGVEIPVVWDDTGAWLVKAGVIDPQKFEALYAGRGGLDEEERRLLYEKGNGTLRIDAKNAGFLLNMLWALGLGQKDSILEDGPMRDPRYGGAERFASTGGWSLAKGDAMTHYGKHRFMPALTAEQQALVEEVSKNVFRPCCDNSTYFPDCNHGMAMLGLLELMASQGATDDQMYRTALQVNAYWFPSQYLTVAKAFKKRGIEWKDVDPKEALSASYSSSSGYGAVAQDVGPAQYGSGQGCGA